MKYQPILKPSFTDFELKVLRTALHYYEADVMDSNNEHRFIDDPGATQEDIADLKDTIGLAIRVSKKLKEKIQEKYTDVAN